MLHGEFKIRVFCDNPSFQFILNPNREKKCFRCYSTSHLANECGNEIICELCGQSGHKQSECEGKKEIEQYGDYRYEIAEGRETDPFDIMKPEKKEKEPEKNRDDKVQLTTGATHITKPANGTKKTATNLYKLHYQE